MPLVIPGEDEKKKAEDDDAFPDELDEINEESLDSLGDPDAEVQVEEHTPEEVEDNEPFVEVKLLDEDPFNGKPRVYIGEYAIVLRDKFNFDAFVYGLGPPIPGKEPVTKYRMLGHYGSLRIAVRAIGRNLEECALKLADRRHLDEAIQYLKRRDQELQSSLRDLVPSDFASGVVLRSTSVSTTSPKKKDP